MTWPVALLVWLAVGAWIAWLWGAVAHEPDLDNTNPAKAGKISRDERNV